MQRWTPYQPNKKDHLDINSFQKVWFTIWICHSLHLLYFISSFMLGVTMMVQKINGCLLTYHSWWWGVSQSPPYILILNLLMTFMLTINRSRCQMKLSNHMNKIFLQDISSENSFSYWVFACISPLKFYIEHHRTIISRSMSTLPKSFSLNKNNSSSFIFIR